MFTQLTRLLTAVAVASLLSSSSIAQQDPGTGGLVTVLDVASVFDNNPTFKQKMDAIKGEAEALKQEITAKQEQIRTDAMKLQDYEVGSQERNSQEAELERRQTELRTYARQSEQNLLTREAAIYYDTYRTMQTVVGDVAKENNISLVLRFDGSEIDATNRNEVIKGVNRTVVYHRQLDLTKMVTERMNAATANAGAGTEMR